MARILVIEDDPGMRDLMEKSLEEAGHEVFLAADGKQGLKLQRAEAMELIITDIYMPEMEGLEFIRTIRKGTSNIPIIAVTGDTDPRSLESAKKLGAVKTMTKPFRPEELRAAVRMVLNRKR